MRRTVRALLLPVVIFLAVLAVSKEVRATACTGVGMNHQAWKDSDGIGQEPEFCCKFVHVEGLGMPDSANCDPGAPTAAVTLPFTQEGITDTGNITHYGSGIGHEWVVKVCGPPGQSVLLTLTFTNSFGGSVGHFTIQIPPEC